MTKSPFVDWSKHNCNRQKNKSAPKYIKEAPEYNKGGYNHPGEEVGPANERTLTCSFERQVSELQMVKRERERGASLGEDFLYFLKLYLGIVLAIYNKEVLLGFPPLEGFLG